jgi:hypothetical protein
LAAARRDLERLRALKETMTASRIDYWTGRTGIQVVAFIAWIALAALMHTVDK